MCNTPRVLWNLFIFLLQVLASPLLVIAEGGAGDEAKGLFKLDIFRTL